MLFPRPMDETRLAEEFLGRMQAVEFDGSQYETIAKLSDDELRQIVCLTAKEPGVSGGQEWHQRVAKPAGAQKD